jgi:hypothetical protein
MEGSTPHNRSSLLTRPQTPVRARRAAMWILAGLLPFASACVYLRLLDVKNQIKKFDDNFALTGRPELAINFKNPVILAKDVRFLIGADPLKVRQAGLEEAWDYEFEMVLPSTTAAPAPMAKQSLELRIREGKLVTLIIPESFLMLFPRNVMAETIRNAATATVVKRLRMLTATMRLSPASDAELPSRARAVLLLGAPFKIEKSGELDLLIYRYRVIGAKKPVPIIARLGFSSEGLLRQVKVTWDTSTVDAHFIRDAGAAEAAPPVPTEEPAPDARP